MHLPIFYFNNSSKWRFATLLFLTGDAVLGRTTKEKDLITCNADMKVPEQCGIAALKRNQILGIIRRTFTYKEKQLIIKSTADVT